MNPVKKRTAEWTRARGCHGAAPLLSGAEAGTERSISPWAKLFPRSKRGRIQFCVPLLLLLVAAWGSVPQAQAQTAQFSYAQSTIVSGPNTPADVAVDGSGNVYIADYYNNSGRVLKETLQSDGSYTQSIIVSGQIVPYGVAVDGSGNVYITESYYNGGRVLKETLQSDGSYTQSIIVFGQLFVPQGVAVDSSGNVYITSSYDNNPSVLKETPSGGSYILSTIPASGLSFAGGVAVDSNGNVYIANSTPNGGVLKETPSGGTYIQSTIPTSGQSYPTDVAVDGSGNVYIADNDNDRVLKETPSGGSYIQSIILNSVLSDPSGVAVDGSGNVYIADTGNNRVLKLQTAGVNFDSEAVGSTTAAQPLTFTFDTGGTIGKPLVLTGGAPGLDFADAGTGTCDTNGTSHSYNAGDTCTVDVTFTPKYAGTRDGAVELTNSAGAVIATAYVYGTGVGPQVAFSPGTQSSIPANGQYGPTGVAVDGSGNIYIVDSNNNRVLKETFSGSTYTQSTIASGLYFPEGVAVDGSGNVYIADTGNDRVLKETLQSDGSYTQSSIVSNLSNPWGVAVDGSGNVYIADTSNDRVLKETLQSDGSYIQSTIPTSGLGLPEGVTVDGSGNVYIADTNNNRVLKETLQSDGSYTQSSIVSNLSNPGRVAVDGSGNVYIADSGNSRVLKEDLVDAPSLSFASTAVGSQSSPQTLTVENNGNAALTFPIPTTGNNPSLPANFSYDNSSTCVQADTSSATAFTLATGASCALAIDFAPKSAGSISGSAVLTDNNLNAAAPNYATQSIALSGTAIQITLTPAAGALPDGTVGTAYSQAFSASGGTAAYTFSSSDLPSWLTLSSSGTLSGTPTAADSYSFVVTATDANSLSESQNYTLTVNKATPGVSGTTPELSYGQSGTSTVTVAGVAGLTPTGTVSYTIDSGASQSVTLAKGTAAISIPGTLAGGSHTISLTYSGDSNYLTATGTVPFTVGNVMPTVSWPAPAAMTYGTALSTTQLDATAAYNGAAVPGTFVYTPAAGTVLSAGTHTLSVQFTPTDTADYATPAAFTVNLVVKQAALTVTAANVTKVYGAANPAFSGTVTGAVHGDTFTESYATKATPDSNVGSYAIVPSVTGADLADYIVTSTNGTLTITKAATVTTLSASASSITPGQSLTLTAQVTDASSGSTGTPTGTVSFYDGATLLGTGTLANGTATYTTSSLAAGVTHSLTASYTGDVDFTGSTSASATSVPVAALGFTLTTSGATSQTVMPGGATSYSFAISPTYGSYPASVTFTATGLPAGATAVFSPATIASNGGQQSVTLTIQTKGSTTAAKNDNPFERGAPIALGLLLVPMLGLRRMRKRWLGRGAMLVLLIVAGIAGVASLSGCGTANGFNGQAVKNYAITVTATSGGVEHSVDVNLNVQ